MNAYRFLGIINLIIYFLYGIKGADTDLLEFYVVAAICWLGIGEIREGFNRTVKAVTLITFSLEQGRADKRKEMPTAQAQQTEREAKR